MGSIVRHCMVDCHHKECCDCERPAELIAEAIGDGVTEFKLCGPHYTLLAQEAARKGVLMIGTSPIEPDAP